MDRGSQLSKDDEDDEDDEEDEEEEERIFTASVTWPLEIGQTVDPWDTLQRWVVKGFLRSMCGICGKKNQFFLLKH